VALHYLENQPDRIHFTDHLKMPEDDDIAKAPRMLAFLDLQPQTMILPMAAELDDGRVITFYDEFFRRSCIEPGRYPEGPPNAQISAAREKYWSLLFGAWSEKKAMDLMEELIGDSGRPRWVDYRLRLDDGRRAHLHLVGHSEVDTGVFAYNIVKRGWSHGVRVVGALRSEPGVTVMAVYDK
jgi:hypothetical protein